MLTCEKEPLADHKLHVVMIDASHNYPNITSLFGSVCAVNLDSDLHD